MIFLMTWAFHRFWLILHFLLVIVNVTESRYLKNADTANQLSQHSMNALDEDIDLETVVEDYYDDLWQYLETFGDKSKKKFNEEKKKEELGQPNFADYDYMSDMAVAPEPIKDEKTHKVTTEKVNGSHGNEQPVNGSQIDLNVLRANRESNSEEEFAQRSKEMRLKSIISQVLSFRGGSMKPNEQMPNVKHFNALREIYEMNKKRIKSEDWTASYTEKVQSFYPSCDMPRNTDEDVWSDPYSMNLLFDLDYPNPQEDSTIMIVSAKLRLYKLAQENYSVPSLETTTPKIKTEKPNGGLGILPGDDDRQIRVSVYWYTRSLRRHRAKKKLLDSQMLSVFRPKWAEFNIRAAVRTWKDSGRNFGLVVTVEDDDGVLLPAEQYIHSMNCSKWTATVRPIPSIIMDKTQQYYADNPMEGKNETSEDGSKSEEEDKRKSYPYEPLLYPIIDLRTREVPNSELKNLALVNSAKIALESRFLNISRREINLNNNSITIFLKNYNQLGGDSDRSVGRKSTDGNVNYFQNVPIGSTSNSNRSPTRKNHGSEERSEGVNLFQNVRIGYPINSNQHRNLFRKAHGLEERVEGEKSPEGEKEMPRIRHGRKQMLQRSSNL